MLGLKLMIFEAYKLLNIFNMKKITLLLAMLVVSFGYSQTLPIDFEESDDSNIFASVSDGGTFNIIDDADNAGESVGEFSGKVGGALYDHINVPLTTSLDIAATNTISFRVKQTTTEGTTSHLFKLQPNGGTGSNQEVAFTTEYDVWKDVSLTYSGTGTYNELIIFFDFNSASVSGTYLIDDIVASSGTPAAAYDLPFDFETSPVTSDWEGFEGAGITVEAVAAPQTTGNSSTNLAKIIRNGGQAFAGVVTTVDTALDFSTNSTITARIWTSAPIGTKIMFKTEEAGNAGNNSGEKDVFTTKTGEWEDLVFDFAGVGSTAHTKLVIIPDNGNVGDGSAASTFYFDDIIQAAPTAASQTITVSIDVSADPGGVNIVTPTVSGNWAEYAATVDPNNANKYSYTFAEGVTSAEFVWKVYGTSAGDVQESLTSLVGGGAIENNLAATLPTGNGINTDYSTYCNRTVASDSGDFVAPTFVFNSFKQVGVTYTELVLTADSGDSYAIDYSVNDYSEYHGPGATDNGDGTYTVIVDPSSAFTYLWYNITTSTQEDLSACDSSNRDHAAGDSEADSFGVCPTTASQTITVSIDVSADPGGVNIVTPTVSGNWAEYAATVDPNNANKYSYTFAEGVTSAEFVWKVYGTSAGDVQESLTSLVGGGAIENNLAATLPTGNGINTDYSTYCNRTVASDSGDFVAPTFVFNSFKQVGVTYTELVLTADSGDSYAIDYSVNDYSEYHGPGATDNGDGTYTVIVDPSSAFTYLWYNITTSTQEDLSACDSSNRDHAAGDSEADSFGVCPTTASQTITVSIDVSADPGGVNIVTPTVSGNWAEYAATVDPNNANKYSYTFAEGVTSAEFVWKVYGTSAGDVQESLTSLVGGGAIENNLAATLPTGNGINTDYSTYCNRTVASDSGDFVAPTFIFNSFKQVGVTYTELVLTADSGDSYAIDYSVNDYSEYHGPGATDNGDGTYTVIVDPSSAFTYLWYNITTSTQEDLSACDSSNRDHAAGDSEADSFGVCPTTASQTITVSIDVSADPGGVNIVTPTVSGNWAEYAATVDPNNANKYSYTFAEGVTSAEFVWKVYGTSAGDVQESLTSLVGGGAIENNLAATLPTGNGINTDYSTYCNRTVASDSGDFVAPTFIFNSFKQVGVTYTELVLTADSGDSYAIDYSVNDYSEYHGPGATDNGDGTYTVIVDPSSAFTYLWYNITTSTQEDLSACGSSNRNHTAGVSEADTFGVCPASADVKDNNILNVSVYPNPSNSDWNFRTPNTVINSVEVFNLLGKRVASQRSNNNTEISISTQGLTSGIYIARITTEQGTKSVKLIKN